MKIGKTIVVAVDFADDPGAREEKDGVNSAKRFLDELLKPEFIKATKGGYILKIDLDGVYGYPSSFVSGSFGKLSIDYGSKLVLEHLDFKSDRKPIRKDKIIAEIMKPEKDK